MQRLIKFNLNYRWVDYYTMALQLEVEMEMSKLVLGSLPPIVQNCYPISKKKNSCSYICRGLKTAAESLLRS